MLCDTAPPDLPPKTGRDDNYARNYRKIIYEKSNVFNKNE
jgi:hypothetical protein